MRPSVRSLIDRFRKVAKKGPRHALSLKTTHLVESCFGPIEAYVDDVITDQIIEFGNHTRPEFAFACSVLSPRAQLFDLGAHIGTFSMTALGKMMGGGSILAVEGNPVTAAILSRNLMRVADPKQRGRQPGRSIEVLNAFVAVQDGDFAIQENRANTGASMLVPRATGPNMAPAVQPFYGIDALVDRYFPPDYIKLDTEGTEGQVLTGSRFVADAKPLIYLEVNERTLAAFGTTTSDLDDLFGRLGYGLYVNSFDRNGGHDLYRIDRITTLTGRGAFFDVLCVPVTHEMYKVLSRLCAP